VLVQLSDTNVKSTKNLEMWFLELQRNKGSRSPYESPKMTWIRLVLEGKMWEAKKSLGRKEEMISLL
jgi:hypothetical protein